METFIDNNGGRVTVSFQKDSFSKRAEHVLVICRFYDQWLLTKHKERGWEFPGGKKEENETLEEAARREVMEETGAILQSLHYIGEYEVNSEEDSFVKAIFYAEAASLQPQENYYETNGPVLIGGDLLSLRFQDSYSFIMKDKVIELALEKAALLEKV
ncbi:RNA deprotection pyrophosphohydrolase [Niallia oryzisoli]|uniref:RNA deprotection pyrophosphohydrolase n=1 Tax=Niallia oryzisoli TaxID=1737571 RepID=UPI003735DDEF